ncbi:ligase-associated DNA damage response endonuclease PdeM [Candidatus Gracilibacteria bacterium]|nr:ligase-associated DNA damage response endonuclease PdeM [Candidatus Gracilibacteria bacterium]
MPDLTTTIAGESVLLMPERALYWPRGGALFVADLHWGKAAAFRAAAIAVPEQATAADLARLDAALERSGARQLYLLGDLFHARSGRSDPTLAAIAAWRARHPELAIVLVRGNHDKHAGDPPADWGIDCVSEPYPRLLFVLRHTPEPDERGYVLAGHLHPAVALHGRGRQRERLPCFLFGQQYGLLPAFGSFTGSATIQPTAQDRVFVVAGDSVIAVQ